jgi:fructan beta-fructosidase
MNDPNGLVYYEGEYHFFYQYHPYSTEWGPMHWGHAVSPDLVHWENLPVALSPDEHGDIWSGSVIADHENVSGLVPGGGLVTFFSYNTQTQGIAYSTDRGRTWEKYAGNPIIPALHHDFRDPKVFWHDGAQHWVMVLASGRSITIMTSDNLIRWEVASTFSGSYGEEGVWETPDLFPLTVDGLTKWVMLVSINPGGPAGGSAARYHLGEFDGRTFADDHPDQILWLDYGPDNYAGATWNNSPHSQRLLIGWMNNWAYANQVPTSTWRGAATLPRVLSLRQTPDGLRLVQTPVEALTQLRQPVGRWENQTIEGELVLDGLQGQRLELVGDFELGTASSFGFELYRSAHEAVRVAYMATEQQLIVERPPSGIRDFAPTFSAPLAPENNHIRLHLFLDQSSLEIFANGGLVSVTSQVFPDPEGRGVTLFADNGRVCLVSLEAYALASIWRTQP